MYIKKADIDRIRFGMSTPQEERDEMRQEQKEREEVREVYRSYNIRQDGRDYGDTWTGCWERRLETADRSIQ